MMLRLVAVAVFAAALGQGEVIDRVAVSVGNRVITTSEIEREARLAALLNNKEPDLSQAGRKKTAERLIEQRLVKRELEAARYPAPDPAEVDANLRELKARYKTPEAYKAVLRHYGISDEDVRDYVTWQQVFLKFIDVRFRPAVQISDEDIKDYFEKTVRPLAEKANPAAKPQLEDYRQKIEETLEGKRVDEELERWLQAARRRNRVEYREGVFQ